MKNCKTCQGNGEVVTDWDRYLDAHPGDVGDEAVAECPDCDGTGAEAPLVTTQPSLIEVLADKSPYYQERVQSQTHAWAEGRPYHNRVDNECCPDFSCCQPDLFEPDPAKRWEYYRKHHGLNS